MTVTYWSNFSKRKNSTLQPTTGTDVTVRLKEDCSIINPVFESATMPATANYIYVSEWGRYYFVTNVVFISNTVKAFSCEVDVLASFKTQIGSTVARIAFAATGYDTDIIDSRIAVSTKKLKYSRAKATELTDHGCYILTVFNNSITSSNGLGISYALEESEIGKIKSWMSDNNVITAIRNFFGGNPIDSIFSCIWVPFPYANVPQVAAVSHIQIGDQDSTNEGVTINAKIIADTGIRKATQITVDIPYRYNDFRDSEPFSSLQIFLPGIGYTSLNIGDWLDTVSLKVDYVMEYATGDLTYYLRDYNDYMIQTASCNVASQCPLGQVMTSGGGIISGMGGAVGGMGAIALGAITENPVMAVGGAAALLTGASNIALNANKRATSLKGNTGGRTTTDIRDVIITGFYMDTEDVTSVSYIAQKGRPVGVTHAISNHSGYVQCDNASVGNIGTPIEKDRVNQYLNTGFFYE